MAKLKWHKDGEGFWYGMLGGYHLCSIEGETGNYHFADVADHRHSLIWPRLIAATSLMKPSRPRSAIMRRACASVMSPMVS